MIKRGYSGYAARRNICYVTHFGRFLREKGFKSIERLNALTNDKMLDSYMRHLKRTGHNWWIHGIHNFIKAPGRTGVLKPAVKPGF